MSEPLGNVSIEPRPYDLSEPGEVLRLLREVEGYLAACERQHHGTDFDGRLYARSGLAALRTKLGSEPETAKLREALAWYGDEKNYVGRAAGAEWVKPVELDRGERARAALTTDGGDRG